MPNFVKISATGNDFLLIDELEQKSDFSAADIPQWCHRQNGFGADGVVLIKGHNLHSFEWVYYNSDGGEAELCGNAARAVSRYYALKTGKTEFSFLTRVGVVLAKVTNPNSFSDKVEVHLPKWTELKEMGDFTFVNTGVPHAVVEVPTLNLLESLKSKALKIKALPQFLKNGVNVTFRTVTQGQKPISSITFERGVENFTLSCGTGAIAAAVSAEHGQEKFLRVVEVPGGVLTVEAQTSLVALSGEATVIGLCKPGVFK